MTNNKQNTTPKGYKQTKLGIIPDDWELSTLGTNLEKIMGGGTPSRDNPKYWNGSIPWVTVKDFSSFNPNSSQEYITKEGLRKSSSNLIPSGILITPTRMALGKAVIYNVDVSINQDLKALFPNSNLATDFLYQWFLKNKARIDFLGTGSTVKGIQLGEFRNLSFLLPPLPEQKRIAQILTTWDKAISNQQLLIDKYKLKKKGLMQKLLAPKKDWKEVRLHQIVINKGIVRGPFGGALKKEIFVDYGYKVYEQKNAIYKSTEIGKYYVKEDKYIEMQRFSVKENDLIISCSGTIGRIYKIPKIHPKGIINQALLKLTLNTELININFFLFQFKSEKIQFNIIESTQGGAMKNLVGMSEFRNTKFVLPLVEEQTKIANILSSADKEIEILEKQLEKLKEQKKGLMQVLLSGQKRVKIKN